MLRGCGSALISSGQMNIINPPMDASSNTTADNAPTGIAERRPLAGRLLSGREEVTGRSSGHSSRSGPVGAQDLEPFGDLIDGQPAGRGKYLGDLRGEHR